MATDEKEHRSIHPAGILLALGALGLLLLLMFQPRPDSGVPADQGPIAMALVNELMTNGVLVDYDCLKSTAWVNRAVWTKYTVDQRRNMVISLATVCERQRGSYRISIVDYDAKREIASFDGKSLKMDQ